MSPLYFGIICDIRKKMLITIVISARQTGHPASIHNWHAHSTRFTEPRMSARHQCEASTWRHEAHFAAFVRSWCSCCRCRFWCHWSCRSWYTGAWLSSSSLLLLLSSRGCRDSVWVLTSLLVKNVWKPFIKQCSKILYNTWLIVIPLKSSYVVALDRQC